MTDDISMSAPDIDERDEAAVLGALRSGILGLGPRAEELERLAANMAGVEHGIAVSSGTAALHLIVRALGIGPGDDVLVPSFTFAASVNAFVFEGANPVFLDIDPETYNLDPEQIAGKRTTATRAVMVVDVFGHPADWDGIKRTASELMLINDACEAVGSTFRGIPIGYFGRASAFAFYPNKQMTTGEGGMIVTSDDAIARLCRSLRNQGRGEMGAWLHHERLGYNYRLDELSAALGVSQMKRLGELVQKRAMVAARYSERLAACELLRVPVVRSEVAMSWFVYVVTLAHGVDRDDVVARLSGEGIPSRAYFPPVHLQPYIRERFGTREDMLPITEDIAPRTLALPFHGNLTETQVDRVVDALERAVNRSIGSRGGS